MMGPAQVVHRQIWREGGSSVGSRSIPEETAVALTYNGGTYAVMMATPQDLQDFAVGFSLSEGVIDSLADIDSLDIVRLDDGVEFRIWLNNPRADHLQDRRRHIAGPTGCGLCGIESIAEALRPAAVIGYDREF
jgi:FdhD protein